MGNCELLPLLADTEYEMDKVNGEYGTNEDMCLFCRSNTWNGKEGIEHSEECPVQRLRDKIKQLGGVLRLR